MAQRDEATVAPIILVVEDDPNLAQILEVNLRRRGYRVVVAEDGLEACRMVAIHRPKAILLDIMLPDLSGLTVCSMVRSHTDKGLARIPIIMLSALGTAEDKAWGMNAGASAYLTKPYAIRDLLHQLKIVLTCDPVPS